MVDVPFQDEDVLWQDEDVLFEGMGAPLIVGDTYYVDTASAGGDGTTDAVAGAQAAFATVAAAQAAVVGDQSDNGLVFKRGCTWREQFTVGANGTAGHPFTIGAYGSGADPIISGSALLAGGWSEYVPDAWVTALAMTDNHTYDDATNQELRTYIPANTSPNSGIKVRVSVKASANDAAVGGTSIGVMTAVDDYDAVPTRITWDTGSDTTTVTANTTKVSDEIAFAFNKTVRHGIHFHWPTGVHNKGEQLPAVGGQYYVITAVDRTMTQVIVGTADANIVGLLKLEVYDDTVTQADTWKVALATEPKTVFFNGTRGTHVGAIALVNGVGKWFWAANILYVYSTSDPATAFTAPGVEASARTSMEIVNKSYLTVEDLDVCHSNGDGNIIVWSDSAAMTGITFRRVTARDTYDNGFHVLNMHVDAFLTTNVLFEDCIAHDNGGSGINLGWGVNDTIVRRCTTYNNSWYDPLWEGGIHLWGGFDDHLFGNKESGSGLLVEHCTSYANGNAGIYIDEPLSVPTKPIIRYNTVYGNTAGGIDTEHNAGIEIYYNLSYNNTGDGITLYREIGGVTVYNNVVYGNANGIAVLGENVAETGMLGNLVRNNIVFGNTTHQLITRFGGENDGVMGSGNVYEYNSFGPEAANFIEWGNGVHKSTYDAWETAYGGTTHSVESDPLFVSAATGDFHLLSNSPCINAGTYVGLTQDYYGNVVPQGGYVDIGGSEGLQRLLSLYHMWLPIFRRRERTAG